MSKSIISIPTRTRADWHYAVELEVLQRELDEGNPVGVAIPDWAGVMADTFPHVPAHWKNSFWKRYAYYARVLKGYSLLSGQPRIGHLERFQTDEKFESFLREVRPQIGSVRDFIDIDYDGWDIGAAAVSAYVSATRDLHGDPGYFWPRLEGFARGSHYMYRAVQALIVNQKPDRLLVFNGRFSCSRPVLRVSQKMGVECVVHESGGSKDHFALFRGCLPHDQEPFRKRLRDFYANTDRDKVHTLGKEFYEERRGGLTQGTWVNFLAEQKEGLLPEDWNSDRRNLAVFTSSEDEFVSISSEWLEGLYSSQIEGVRRLIESKGSLDGVEIWIRLHPNLRYADERQTQEWVELVDGVDGVNLIMPESPISTYALIDVADVVMSFGSTVGIEATYWGRPSILGGTSFYKDLGVVYQPVDHEELVAMVGDRNLGAMDPEWALAYAAYFKCFGESLKYAKATSYTEAEFCGYDLGSRTPVLAMAAKLALFGPSESLQWQGR